MTKETLSLKAQTREETGKKVNQLREQGKIPAVLYGREVKPVNLKVDKSVFEKVHKQAGESTLLDLIIDDQKPVKVLIHDYQLDPRINQFIHVDFHQVRMDEKIHAEIPIKFIGEAPAVKTHGAIMVTNLDFLTVECLPSDLVHEIEVDLSGLKEIDDSVHVSDVKVPSGIVIKNLAEDMIALIQEPRSAQDVADASSPVIAPEVPVEEPKAEGANDQTQLKSEEK